MYGQISPKKERPLWFYYAAYSFVIFFWGISSILYTFLYRYFSATVLSTVMTFFSALFFLALSARKLHLLNKDYFKTALPICLLNALACVMQRIGLQYTTPANYAFLEHLACVAAPAAVFVFTRKRPTRVQGFACLICLAGCFILSGLGNSGFSLPGIGDLLCALAGILFGICTAATGIYAGHLDTSLYMLLHTGSYFLVSLTAMLTLNTVRIGGQVMEPAVFTFRLPLLLFTVIAGVMDIAVCWYIRTKAVCRIGPTKVAVIAPFAAVITGIGSVILGLDPLSGSLVIGGLLILSAVLLPELVRTRQN